MLAQTRRAVPTWGFDVVVLLELCLRGAVVVVPEPLFSYRLFESKTQDDLAAGLAGAEQQRSISACWSCMTVEMLRSIWLAPGGPVRRLMWSVEFLFVFCVLNRPVSAGIRTSLTDSIRRAWAEGKQRQWGSAAGHRRPGLPDAKPGDSCNLQVVEEGAYLVSCGSYGHATRLELCVVQKRIAGLN